MSIPTVLAPWFVVQKMFTTQWDGQEIRVMRYYCTGDEGAPIWTENQHEAMLFMSIQSAHRVARATAGEARVLCDREDLTEFRPEGEL